MTACSWCGDQDEDITLVAGPNNLMICSDCVAVCVASLGKEMVDPDATRLHAGAIWEIPEDDPIPFLAKFFDVHGTLIIGVQKKAKIIFTISLTFMTKRHDIAQFFQQTLGGSAYRNKTVKNAAYSTWMMTRHVSGAIDILYPHIVRQRPFFDIGRHFLAQRHAMPYFLTDDNRNELMVIRNQLIALRKNPEAQQKARTQRILYQAANFTDKHITTVQ